MWPVVELVTSCLSDVVRKHHVHRAIGPQALCSLDRKDLKSAKNKEKQDNRNIGCAQTFFRGNRRRS